MLYLCLLYVFCFSAVCNVLSMCLLSVCCLLVCLLYVCRLSGCLLYVCLLYVGVRSLLSDITCLMSIYPTPCHLSAVFYLLCYTCLFGTYSITVCCISVWCLSVIQFLLSSVWLHYHVAVFCRPAVCLSAISLSSCQLSVYHMVYICLAAITAVCLLSACYLLLICNTILKGVYMNVQQIVHLAYFCFRYSHNFVWPCKIMINTIYIFFENKNMLCMIVTIF